MILVDIKKDFKFYLYSLEYRNTQGNNVESRHRRTLLFFHGLNELLLKHLSKTKQEAIKRTIFFSGSYFFSSRPITGLVHQQIPREIVDGTTTEGDCVTVKNVRCFTAPEVLIRTHEDSTAFPLEMLDESRCSDCSSTYRTLAAMLDHCQATGHTPIMVESGITSTPALPEVFVSFVNVVLRKALADRLAPWSKSWIDPNSSIPAKGRNGQDLGAEIFRAYSVRFNICHPGVTPEGFQKPHQLALTVDLSAKVIRTKSLLHAMCGSENPNYVQFSDKVIKSHKDQWIGQVVISRLDKKCYIVNDLLFGHSANSLPVVGLGISHSEYYEFHKGLKLEFPNASPMIAVEGRRNTIIHLPAEIVCGNDLDKKLMEILPQIASFTPKDRHEAIDMIKRFLKPSGTEGAQRSHGGALLPSCGIVLHETRLSVPAFVLPAPSIGAAGMNVPGNKALYWGGILGNASFNVQPKEATEMNVVVVYNRCLRNWEDVYEKISSIVNKYSATYRFPRRPYAAVEAGNGPDHCLAVITFFDKANLPPNVFVLDFTKPLGDKDSAYGPIKQMLAKGGFLSQFVNFNKCNHCDIRRDRDTKSSKMILDGVSRQILSKCGHQIW